MVRTKTTYTTSDGREFTSKKNAQRHENVLFMERAGHTEQEVNEIIVKLAETKGVIRNFLASKEYNIWQDWSDWHLGQLAELITDFKANIVTYELLDNKNNSVSSIKQKESDDIPQAFIDHVSNLKRDGYVYSLEKTDTPRTYKIVETKLAVEKLIEDNVPLTEADIERMYWENETVYEREGEDRRWSRSVLSVVKLSNGDLYAIEWDKGLTEYQESSFYNQPRKVKELKREVKVIEVVEIKVIYDDEEQV